MTELAAQKLRQAKLIFLMAAGAIGIGLLVMGVYQMVEFSDSTAFCGKLCHKVMYPEYTAYQASPHSSVQCAQCHVGSGADYLVRSKISGIPLIFSTIFGHYDRPIPTPVQNLRPARDTCEECHRPEYFAGDQVLVHTTYAQDATNTATTDTRILRVGGGSADVATGIHWHVAAQVWYLPLDNERQDIAWVGVVDKNGQLTEYYNMSEVAQVTPESVKAGARLMDCIDCHNRATHIFSKPEDLIDTAMSVGQIDPSLPYIKREAMKAVGTIAPTLDEAYQKADAILDFYRTNYPDLSNYDKAKIDSAIEAIKNVARLTTFPDMKVTPETYLNNAGHMDSPGCMRCHGKLVGTTPGPSEGKTVSEDCTLCHYFQTGTPLPKQ